MVPKDRLDRPEGKSQLAILRSIYLSSIGRRQIVGSQQRKSENDELAQVLDSCGCAEYFDRFISEGVTVDLIPLLETQELSELVPKLGPKKRLELWAKQQKQ